MAGIITLAAGEECEGNAFESVCQPVCLSMRVIQKQLHRYTIFFTQEVLSPWLGPLTKMIRIGFHIWTQEFTKGIFTIAR